MAGKMTVICGPMFAGKSTELMRRVRRARLAGLDVLLLKPRIDTRSGTLVQSHDGIGMEAELLREDVWRISDIMPRDAQVIAIDEAQFFVNDLLPYILSDLTKEEGIDVVVAGLDLDYRGKPFGLMPLFLSLADEVVKLTAICRVCGKEANRTQRLVNGVPAGLGPVVQIGGKDSYEARCLDCWVSPVEVALDQTLHGNKAALDCR